MRLSLCSARLLTVATAGLLALGGCELTTGPRRGDFRGIYVHAFEASSFRPCWRRERWWLSGELGPIFAVMPPIDPASARAAYGHVRGTLSRPGRHGHAGGWRYELVVDEVLEASADTLGKCR
jgi:hypothetical protein